MNLNFPRIVIFLTIFIANFLVQISYAQSTNYSLTDVVSISATNTKIYENWPESSLFAIRRTGGLKAVTISLSISCTAILGADFLSNASQTITIPAGRREVWVNIKPLTDAIVEAEETYRITILTSPNYTISGINFAEINIIDSSNLPNDVEATRFLIQAGFGADPDELGDVKALGFEAWIDQQFTRPKGYLQPVIAAKAATGAPIYHPETKIALWTQFMRRRYPPSGGTVATDILRQKIAHCLLQIFVVSQNTDMLSGHSEGVTHFYDKLMDGAFGNYRQLLLDVTMHPCMGAYLSHLGNRKPNPALNIFPDENYAREIMQLFSIGLWELNPNGTRKLDENGNEIPTYTNQNITQFARVFTGLKWGGPDNGTDFDYVYENNNAYLHPMRVFENQHDTDEKTLLNGQILPSGQTTEQDINGAIDNLYNHPNTGPFIARLLIQRLVTSNPSPEYIERVAIKFTDNGNGVRGDMSAVVKQILLDKEARSYSKTKENTFGKMREPYMTLMNMAKTFNAQPVSGNYESATYLYDFYLQEPFQSPSVFNFYSPNFRPPGQLTNLNKFAPEFQILTAVTAIESQNNLLNSVENEIARWGSSNPNNRLILNFSQEIPLANDADRLISHLSTKLIGGNLRPKTFQSIREAVLKIQTIEADWQIKRVKLATYLIGSSAEFNIQK